MKEEKHIPALAFDGLTRFYDRVVSITMPEKKFRTALIQKAFKADIQARVLEFGIGTASNAILAKQTFPQLDYLGLDVDQKILDIAHEKLVSSGLDVELVKYDGVSLTFEDNQFDIVVSSLVFHHLSPEQKKKAFAELYRVLRPNGRLVFVDWGKPTHFGTRIGFFLLRMFDGFKNTKDHGNGNYLKIIERVGFQMPQRSKHFNTIFGTLELIETVKRINK